MTEQITLLLERLDQLWQRVDSYLTTAWWEVAIELAVIWVVVFVILRFLKGTRGERVVKAVAVILVVGTVAFRVLGGENALERLNFLYSNFLAFISLMLVIVFQPELRRALVRLGEAKLWRQSGLRKARVIDELVEATAQMAKNKIGMLVALERQVGLRGLAESGTRLDAEVSRQLLATIFWPNTALHDLGVIIKDDRVVAAGVQFPLADSSMVAQELGSRHRAAIGLSQEFDALVVVVSEETGTISVAERGELTRELDPDALRRILTKGLGRFAVPAREGFDDTPIDPAADADAVAGSVFREPEPARSSVDHTPAPTANGSTPPPSNAPASTKTP
ncbi:MAG: diadenylate cyclase CdaA [Planctomycetota bacterium]